MPAEARTAAPLKAGAPISSASALTAPVRLAATSTVAGRPNREVFGFALASSLADSTIGYPSWDFNMLTTVAFFGLHVDTTGHFARDAGWTTWNSASLRNLLSIAHQHGVKVVLTIVLQDFSANTPRMCAGLAHMVTTVAQTLTEVRAKGLDGVNIDYEGLDGSCGHTDPYWAQHAVTSLARKMRAAFGAGPYISIDTYAGAANDPYGFFDVVGLAPYVNSFFVMAYDMEYSNYHYAPLSCSAFCLSPTSPLTAYHYNATNVVARYKAKVAASKVILGVPYYGRKACVASATPNARPTSSVVADSYLDAAGEEAYFEVQPGSYVIHRESNSAGSERWDTWYNTTLKCIRELYWDDAVSLAKKYDLVNAAGIRGVGIWNLNYGGGAPELWSALSSHFAPCGPASISASIPSPQATGAQVTFSSATSVCATPQWRFWVQAPGGAWKIAQDYSSNRYFTWTDTGRPGTYQIEVDVRSSPNVSYDSVARLTYALSSCASAALSLDHSSPQRPGVAIALTGTATCPGTAQYRFWVQPPGGAWGIVQDYGATNIYSWNTTGKAVGTYGLELDVRNQGATGTYEAVARATFALVTPCTTPTLSVSPASPQAIGTQVLLTSTTAVCPHPQWRFWIQPPGGAWTVVQGYSSTRTYTWNTTGKTSGTYHLEVDVRDTSTRDSYDAVANMTTVLATCGGATLSTDKASPQPPGSTMRLTGSASCPGTAQYRFWIRQPGGSWNIVQDYSSASTFTWNTAGKPNGWYGLEVDVRDLGSTATYETVANLNFLVDACTAATLRADKTSPQPRGTTIVLTGGATCRGTPQYRFWVKAPGGAWTIVQDYSSASTYRWNTTGLPAGTYGLEVDVRDQGSTAVYETVANRSFVISP